MKLSFRHLITSIILLPLILAGGCIIDHLEPSTTLVNVGNKIPIFRILMNDGSTLSTDDLLNHRSLILFFNTSCSDCQLELPVVNEFHKLRPNIMTVCISRDESDASIASYWHENNISLPYSAQIDRCVYSLFATEGIPRLYAVDESLHVIAMFDDSDMPSVDILNEIFPQEE